MIAVRGVCCLEPWVTRVLSVPGQEEKTHNSSQRGEKVRMGEYFSNKYLFVFNWDSVNPHLTHLFSDILKLLAEKLGNVWKIYKSRRKLLVTNHLEEYSPMKVRREKITNNNVTCKLSPT